MKDYFRRESSQVKFYVGVAATIGVSLIMHTLHDKRLIKQVIREMRKEQ